MKKLYFYVGFVTVGAQCALMSSQDAALSKAVVPTHSAGKASTADKNMTITGKVTADTKLNNVRAQGVVKEGLVDTAIATTESKEGQKKRQELEAKRTELSTQLKKEEETLIKQVEMFKTKSATMSEIERDAEQKRLIKAERELKSKVEEAEAELKTAMQRAMEEIGKEIEAAVREVAIANDFDVVKDSRSGQVLYAKENVLYTKDLIKEMDKNYNVKVAKNSIAKQPQQTT